MFFTWNYERARSVNCSPVTCAARILSVSMVQFSCPPASLVGGCVTLVFIGGSNILPTFISQSLPL